MYFIVVKFSVKEEFASVFPDLVGPFTAATRAEEGNLWFDWSRSIADESEFVLVEAFRDDDAAAAHVNSQHFQDGLNAMRPVLASTPRIVSRKVDGDGWDTMDELRID